MKKLLSTLLPAFALAFTLNGPAAAASTPDAVVAQMTEQVLAEAGKAGNVSKEEAPQKLKALIESAVMPHVDFRTMTAKTIGPKWREATEEQRQQLMAGFETLLVRTYAGAFSQAKGASFRVKSALPVDDKTTEVRSEVAAPGAREPIAIHYRMELRQDAWKVTDVSVLGMWLVPLFRGQCGPIVNQSGIAGLIRSMSEKTVAAR